MKILETYTPNVEIYSIDEAFLKFEGFDHFDLIESGFRMRKQVRQWTGIPVSVGLAPSKALAKIANKIAKKFDQGRFLFMWFPLPRIWDIILLFFTGLQMAPWVF